jgi:hypothetical protein
LSSDDDEVETFQSKTLKMCRLNPFLLSILFRHHQFKVPLSDPRLAFYLLVMGREMREVRKIQGTWVQIVKDKKTKTIQKKKVSATDNRETPSS